MEYINQTVACRKDGQRQKDISQAALCAVGYMNITKTDEWSAEWPNDFITGLDTFYRDQNIKSVFRTSSKKFQLASSSIR